MTDEPVVLARDKWDAQDRDSIVRTLRRLGEERNGGRPFGPSGPLAWVDHGIYTLSWGAPSSVLIELDFVGTDRYGDTHAEIAIFWSDPLDPLAELRTRVNLVSLTARDRLAAAMAKRTPGLEADWRLMLDQAARWTMRRYRTGDPGLLLRDAADLPGGSDVLSDPPLLEADGPTGLFGDGGSLKSWCALALGASLQTGESHIDGIEISAARRVGYMDWEWSDRRHKRRLARLCGPEMPDLAYIRCNRSIIEERDRLRRWVREFGIDYAIVDSVGLACGSEPESAEVANRFMNVLAALVPASLCIAHVNRAQASDRAGADRPFGSTFWHNSFRRTWYARSVGEAEGHATVGLYNRKANDGPLSSPLALEFAWAGERVAISRRDVREVPELDAQRSIGVRMRELLGRDGAMELHAIAGALDEKIDSVKQAAYRGRSSGSLVNFPGPDGVYRWALKQQEQ